MKSSESRLFRIVVHDYAGHHFPIQLSRHLAGLGHKVLHLYSPDFETPRGRLVSNAELTVEPLSIGRAVTKYALLRRWKQEHAYGRILARRVLDFAPDVVLSGNGGPAIHTALMTEARRAGLPVMIWVQDIYFAGIATVLQRMPAPIRWAAERFVRGVELRALRRADALVLISPDFSSLLSDHGLRHPATHVIENWGPLDAITPRHKDNAWARRHGLNDRFVFLYAGTLGKKHNPGHLAALARAFTDDPAVRVVVVTQGLGRRWLEQTKAAEGLENLLLFDYQPAEELPDVLATADVGVVLLEDFAGALSVPSKVYSTFCAGRALLAAVPAANLCHRVITAVGAGLTVPANDPDAFIAAARRLRGDSGLRQQLAERQRAHALSAFDINVIAEQFLAVMRQVVSGPACAAVERPSPSVSGIIQAQGDGGGECPRPEAELAGALRR